MRLSTMSEARCFLDCHQIGMEPDEGVDAIIGGKAAQLALLSRYGLPVPPSFVIPAPICRSLIPDLLWQSAIAVCSQYAREGTNEEVEKKLQRIRLRIWGLRLRADFRACLYGFLTSQNWHDQVLAVRSSAIGEDGKQHSFAGIYRSELNVVGNDALESAILQVIASLWTLQACAYRESIQCRHDDASMAVIVMPMVDSIAAGVAFTCDPRDGREDRLLISSVYGLADELVTGKVSGEDVIIQRDWSCQDWRVVGRRLAGSSVMQMLDNSRSGKNTKNEADRPYILNDTKAIQLAQLAMRAAKAFDYAQAFLDIEWVFDGEQFFLVQARPISARSSFTYPQLRSQKLIWTNGNTKEIFPFPMKASELEPMLCAINEMLTLAPRLLGIQVLEGLQRARLFDGRLYLNVSAIQWELFQHFDLRPDDVNFIFGGHQPAITLPSRNWHDRLRVARNFLLAFVRFPAYRRRGLREASEVAVNATAWRQQDLSLLEIRELLEELGDRARHTYRQYQGMCLMQGASGTLIQLQKLIDKLCGDESKAIVAALMTEGEKSISAQQGLDLIQLAKLAAQDQIAMRFLTSEEASTPCEIDDALCTTGFKQAYVEFLDKYGHRGNYESYLSRPSWREQTENLHLAIINLVDADIGVLEQRQRQQVEWAWTRLGERCHFFQRILIRQLQRQAKIECNQREFARSHFALIHARSRALMLEIGRRLTEQEKIAAPVDIFHLDYAEIESACIGDLPAYALQNRIIDRKRKIERWEQITVPDVVLQDVHNVAKQSADSQSQEPANVVSVKSQEGSLQWQGIAVSMSSYRGKVVFLESPSEIGTMQQGEVVVAMSTDPSWLPVFLKAGAMIVETGGYLSHTAIVARELGIPSVVNVPGIAKLLKNGDEVWLDGPNGRVVLLAAS
jgi:phosphohistidine swiveling domain-containing protein